MRQGRCGQTHHDDLGLCDVSAVCSGHSSKRRLDSMQRTCVELSWEIAGGEGGLLEVWYSSPRYSARQPESCVLDVVSG